MCDAAVPQGACRRETFEAIADRVRGRRRLGACAGAAFEASRPQPAPRPDKPAEASAAAPPASLRRSSTLPPIVTNLGAPQDIWIRLEGSIIFDPKTLPHPEAVAGADRRRHPRLSADRSLQQLEGPIGLENIRQDLNERAATRSGRQGARVRHPHAGGAMRRAALRRRRARRGNLPGRGADRRSQRAHPRRRRVRERPHHRDGRAADRALGRAGPAHHGDELHALHHRAFVPALRPRPAERAGQSGPHQPVAVHDLLRHGADLRPRLARRPQADDGQPDQPAGGA